jgi:hypothetical protein
MVHEITVVQILCASDMTAKKSRFTIVANLMWPCVQNLNVPLSLEDLLSSVVHSVYVSHKYIFVDLFIAVVSLCLKAFAWDIIASIGWLALM